MQSRISNFIFLTLFNLNFIFASPIQDLSSPVQAIRDQAAIEVHKAFRPSSKSYKFWNTKVKNDFKQGNPISQVLKRLGDYHATEEYFRVHDGMTSVRYRLDDEWVIQLDFDTQEKLSFYTLINSIRQVAVDPPKDFTGTWTLYYINGQKSSEIEYVNGKFSGKKLSYQGNGMKNRLLVYQDGTVDGDDISYGGNNNVLSEGHWKEGKKTGTWKGYHEDGSLRSTYEFSDDHLNGDYLEYYDDGGIDHSTLKDEEHWSKSKEKLVRYYVDGKQDGEDLEYYRSGKPEKKGQYSEGKAVGIWTWYSERGYTNYIFDMQEIKVSSDLMYYLEYLLKSGRKD